MQSYCLGCNGHPVVQTPNIDALAARGTNFRRGYCNNPVCMPSRASMITGKTPRQHGLLTNGNILSPDVPTVTRALADAGYRTHSAGKLHRQPFGGFFGDNLTSAEWGKAWGRGERDHLPASYYGYQTTDFVGGHVTYSFGQYRSWQTEMTCTVATRLDFEPTREGEEAGLTTYMRETHHYEIAVARRGERRVILLRRRILGLQVVVAEEELPAGPVELVCDATPETYTFGYRSGGAPLRLLGTAAVRPISSDDAGTFTGMIFGLHATGNG